MCLCDVKLLENTQLNKKKSKRKQGHLKIKSNESICKTVEELLWKCFLLDNSTTGYVVQYSLSMSNIQNSN